MSKDPKLDRLHATPLFANCDPNELKHLVAIIDTVNVAEGSELFREGRREQFAYVVESGTAEVSVDGQIVAEIPEGEMIGEIGLLLSGPASATVTAKTAMSLLTIPRDRFGSVLEDTPGLGIAIAKELAQRLRNLDQKLH
ncbi:MAG: CRP-like cAMP-binding protein [Verrucomicrobiales bacterium]|jgi:CRP-like cAMP-binding protein